MPGDDRDRIDILENRVEELEQRLEATPAPETVKWLVAQVQGAREVDPEERTTLERYAQMPMDERVFHLAPSEVRATIIFEQWTEWCQRGPYGDEVITTRMERPATLRVLLRERDPTVDVERGEDLQRLQVYRAMRAVHRLSDGAFRYDEAASSPDNTDRETYHALVLEAPGRLPTLPR